MFGRILCDMSTLLIVLKRDVLMVGVDAVWQPGLFEDQILFEISATSCCMPILGIFSNESSR